MAALLLLKRFSGFRYPRSLAIVLLLAAGAVLLWTGPDEGDRVPIPGTAGPVGSDADEPKDPPAGGTEPPEQQKPTERSAQDDVTRAGTLLDLQHVEAALDLYAQAIEKDPESADAHAGKAVAFDRGNRLPEALDEVDLAIAISPKVAAYHRIRSLILWRLKRGPEALTAALNSRTLEPSVASYNVTSYILNTLGESNQSIENARKALELDPNNPEALGHLAYALNSMQRDPEAMEAAQRAVDSNPLSGTARNMKGLVHLRLGENIQALELFNSAIALDGSWYAFYTNKGDAAAANGDPTQAISSYREALERAPQDVYTLGKLGWQLHATQDYPEALKTFDLALRSDSIDHRAMNGRGWTLLSLDRFADAESAYRAMVKVYPKSSVAYRGLGIALQRQDKDQDALDQYDHAIAVDPAWAALYTAKAGLLRTMGKSVDALAVARAGVSAAPSSELYVELGMAEYRNANYLDAVNAFQRAVELSPNWAYAHAALGFFGLDEVDRFEDALKAIDHGLVLDPKLAFAWSSKGWVLMNRMKDYRGAAEAYGRAAELDPSSKYSRTIASALTKAGDHAAAAEAYRDALDIDGPQGQIYQQLGNDLFHDVKCPALALRAFDRAVSEEPDNPTFHIGLAYMLQASGDKVTREKELLKALALLDSDKDVSASDAYDRAEVLYLLGRSREAVDQYSVAISLGYNRVAGLTRQADIYLYSLQDPQSALDTSDRALEAHAGSSEGPATAARIRQIRGVVLKQLDQPQRALDEFRLAVDSSPDPAQWYVRIAEIEFYDFKSELASSANESIDRAIALSPSDGYMRMLKSFIVEELAGPEEALPIAAEAARLAPEDVSARQHLGDVLATLGRTDEAAVERAAAERLRTSPPAPPTPTPKMDAPSCSAYAALVEERQGGSGVPWWPIGAVGLFVVLGAISVVRIRR